jgi:predicted TIM-barrel fold metal-dependent hydrolase
MTGVAARRGEGAGPVSPLGYGLFDADNHYYEPPDCFVGFIEPRYRDRALRLEALPGGGSQLFFGDAPLVTDGTTFAGPTCVRPGALRELLRAKQGALPEDAAREPMRPEYLRRDARLELMDRQGLEAALLFPSFGVMIEYWMRRDPELMYACFAAFNRWLDQTWGFAYRDRIFAAPILSLLDRERAVAQLEWCLARGARVISLLPGPVGGRSPADPHFDAFWARANEARLAVAYHIGDSGYLERYSVDWGEEANPPTYRRSALQWAAFFGDRPIMDTLCALIFHNLFGRYPQLSVLSVENGSIWVDYLLKAMDKMKGMGRGGPWPGGYVPGRPSEVFKRHVWVAPYHEEDIGALIDLLGAGHVLFGSDFPHAEGLARPVEFAEALADRSPDELRRVMRDNAWVVVRRD